MILNTNINFKLTRFDLGISMLLYFFMYSILCFCHETLGSNPEASLEKLLSEMAQLTVTRDFHHNHIADMKEKLATEGQREQESGDQYTDSDRLYRDSLASTIVGAKEIIAELNQQIYDLDHKIIEKRQENTRNAQEQRNGTYSVNHTKPSIRTDSSDYIGTNVSTPREDDIPKPSKQRSNTHHRTQSPPKLRQKERLYYMPKGQPLPPPFPTNNNHRDNLRRREQQPPQSSFPTNSSYRHREQQQQSQCNIQNTRVQEDGAI